MEEIHISHIQNNQVNQELRFFHGIVSSLYLDKNLLYVGKGNFLLIYDIHTNEKIYYKQIFDSNKITHIKLFTLDDNKKTQIIFLSAENHVKYSVFSEIITVNIEFFSIDLQHNDYCMEINLFGDYLIFGFMSNFLEIYTWKIQSQRVLILQKARLFCPEKCIVYSMTSFFNSRESTLILASGTVFRYIVLWTILFQEAEKFPVIHTWYLKGHDGVVFNLSLPNETNLISVSDDRTTRHWKLDHKTMTYTVDPYFGHGARVWDAKINLSNGILVSVSEDCSARIYDIVNKTCLKELSSGHSGKNIKCVEMSDHYIFTGGEDGNVVKWDLARVISEDNLNVNVKMTDDESTTSFTLANDDEQCSKARHMQKNFSPSVKVLHYVRSECLLIGTNHGEVVKYNLEEKRVEGNVFIDEQVRVINSLDVIRNGNESVCLIGLSDGDIAIVDIDMDNIAALCINVFNNIRIPFISNKFYGSDLYVIFSTALGQNKIICVQLNDGISIRMGLYDKLKLDNEFHCSALQMNTGTKYPLPICSFEMIQLRYNEYLVLCGDFGGHVYITLAKKIGDRLYMISEIKFLTIHGNEKVSVLHYCVNENLVYTCGRDGKFKQFIPIHYSNYDFTLKELDSKFRNDVNSLEAVLFNKPSDFENGNLILVGHTGRDLLMLDTKSNIIIHSKDIKGVNRPFDAVIDDEYISYTYSQSACLYNVKFRYKSKKKDFSEQHSRVSFNSSPLHGKIIHMVKLAMITNASCLIVTCSEDTKINFYHCEKEGLSKGEIKYLNQFSRHSGAVRSIEMIERQEIFDDNDNDSGNKLNLYLTFASVGSKSECFLFRCILCIEGNCVRKSRIDFLQELSIAQVNLDSRNMDICSHLVSKRKYMLAFTNTLGNSEVFFYDFDQIEYSYILHRTITLAKTNFISLSIANSLHEDQGKVYYILIHGLSNGCLYLTVTSFFISDPHKTFTELVTEQYQIHQAGINRIQSYQSQYIFSCGENNSIAVSEYKPNENSIQFQVIHMLKQFHYSPVKSIQILQYFGKLLVISGGYDQLVNILEINGTEFRLLKKIKACVAEINSVSASVIGGEIIIASVGQGLEIFVVNF